MKITTKNIKIIIVSIFIITLILIALVKVVAKIELIFNPLPPTIKHGEFPFHLKYEMNGQTYEINDTVICNFDKIEINGGGFGKIRWWEEHLKSGMSRFTLVSDNNVNSIFNPNRINSQIEVFYNYGSATYFMGDPSGATSEKPQFEYLETYSKGPNTIVNDATPLTADQLEKNFGIKIISYKVSPLIKNTFK